jgi:hypothetical protein
MPAPFVPRGAGEAALDELTEVAWDELGHAYGRGAIERHGVDPFSKRTVVRRVPSVPEILWDLVSDDEEERSGAIYDGLLGQLWHQGSLFEATAHAIPFLTALAADPGLPSRRGIALALLLCAESALRDPRTPESHAVIESFRAASDWLRHVRDGQDDGAAEAAELIERALGNGATRLDPELEHLMADLADALDDDPA